MPLLPTIYNLGSLPLRGLSHCPVVLKAPSWIIYTGIPSPTQPAQNAFQIYFLFTLSSLTLTTYTGNSSTSPPLPAFPTMWEPAPPAPQHCPVLSARQDASGRGDLFHYTSSWKQLLCEIPYFANTLRPRPPYLDDALDVAVALGEVHGPQLGRALAVLHVGTEHGPGAFALPADHAAHGVLRGRGVAHVRPRLPRGIPDPGPSGPPRGHFLPATTGQDQGRRRARPRDGGGGGPSQCRWQRMGAQAAAKPPPTLLRASLGKKEAAGHCSAKSFRG